MFFELYEGAVTFMFVRGSGVGWASLYRIILLNLSFPYDQNLSYNLLLRCKRIQRHVFQEENGVLKPETMGQ